MIKLSKCLSKLLVVRLLVEGKTSHVRHVVLDLKGKVLGQLAQGGVDFLVFDQSVFIVFVSARKIHPGKASLKEIYHTVSKSF